MSYERCLIVAFWIFWGYYNVRFALSLQQEEVKTYEYMDSDDVYRKLVELSKEYPDLVQLETAQETYGLPKAGGDSIDNCPLETDGCHNWILTIFDSIANDNPRIKENIPDVLISAGFHGDDRLGPTIVMELASLLLEVTHCESLPRRKFQKPGQSENTNTHHVNRDNDILADPSEETVQEVTWEEEVRRADACRRSLNRRGVYSSHRRWISRLVSNRRIILVPIVNPLAFYKNQPNELHDVDVNFDFPFSVDQKEQCMRTVAARTINELFRSHLIQSTITFHSGESNAPFISYEWGSPFFMQLNTKNPSDGSFYYEAPDALAQKQLSTVFSSYAGDVFSLPNSFYKIGAIHDFVNPVKTNRMEDWSYAASWDTKHLPPFCQPDTYGGYDANKTVYSKAELRSSTIMVQTSKDKMPPPSTLGTDEDLFTPHGNGNGHISRNIRLSLASIDLVEPYVTFLNVADINIGDAFYPQSPKPTTQKECIEQTRVISVPQGLENIQIQWTVGGALYADSTALMYGTWKDLDEDIFNCINQPTQDDLDSFFDEILKGPDHSRERKKVLFTKSSGPGKTFWKPRSSDYATADERSMITSDTVFSTTALDLTSFSEGEMIAVYAVARVDQFFYDINSAQKNVRDHLAPQSHLVNARVNPQWNQRGNDKVIRGRMDWFSIPITLRIGPPGSPIEEITSNDEPSYYKEYEQQQQLYKILKGIAIGVGCALFIIVCLFVREKSNGNDICSIWSQRRSILSTAIPDDEYEPDILDEYEQRKHLKRIEMS